MSACKKDEPVGGTAVQDLSGEWWVQIDGEGDYYGISTYNTADNSSTQMWLNLTNFWSLSDTETVFGKVNVNLESHLKNRVTQLNSLSLFFLIIFFFNFC